jgi:hypothetical protein
MINSKTIEEIPEVLYKYRYFDKKDYHIKLIENASLWFSSAREFNDPFDSILQFQLDDNPVGIRKKWALDYLKRENPNLNNKNRRIIASQRLREIRKDPHYFDWFKEDYIERNYNRFGFCCLSPYNDNLLMWAHYSQNHQGFCVGLDYPKLFDSRQNLALKGKVIELKKILYSEEMPIVNLYSSRLSNHWENDIMTLLCTKSKHWEYEQEYRIILWNNINTLLNIGHDKIKEVILGCRISNENKARILKLIKELMPEIKIFQSIKHKTRFALKFEQIN